MSYPYDPKPPKISLALLSADEGVLPGVKISLLGDFVEPSFGHPHAFGSLQNLLMTLFPGGSRFNSHGFLTARQKGYCPISFLIFLFQAPLTSLVFF